MSEEHNFLAARVAALEARVIDLAAYLHSAIEYLSSDPQSSLTKSRVILEKVLLALYRLILKKDPVRPMIGDMLTDKTFAATIPRRILARMNAVRDMSNLGPHGEEVDAADAVRVMRDLVDILDWYVVKYDPACLRSGGQEFRQSLEILPQLKAKYPRYLRPEITSVKLVQTPVRCYLEMTTAEPIGDYLDEISKRTDLGFIAGDAGPDDRMFPPTSPLTENARRFVSDFDEFSIINCTDLFTPAAAEGSAERKPNADVRTFVKSADACIPRRNCTRITKCTSMAHITTGKDQIAIVWSVGLVLGRTTARRSTQRKMRPEAINPHQGTHDAHGRSTSANRLPAARVPAAIEQQLRGECADFDVVAKEAALVELYWQGKLTHISSPPRWTWIALPSMRC